MSRISDAFKGHRIWAALENWGKMLDAALTVDFINEDAAEALARMRAVLTFLGKRLENADPFLFRLNWLESLATFADRLSAQLTLYTAGDTAALIPASEITDELLAVMATMPSPATTTEFKGAKQAAEDYRKALDSMIRSARTASEDNKNELAGLKSRLAELATEMAAERARLTGLTSDFQSQFSAAQESRSQTEVAAQKDRDSKFNSVIDAQKQSLLERETSLRALEDETRKSHDALISQMRAEFGAVRDTAAQAHAKQLSDLHSEFVSKASTLRDEMVARKEEIEKLVGVIGNLGVTSGFLTNANSARKAMWAWQSVTVAAIVGLIVVALVFFLPASSTPFSWPGFAGRVFVSLTFAALAGYAAKEAANNQRTESVNRRIALELEAVRPFIVSLPSEQQEAFINKLGDRTFGVIPANQALVGHDSLPPGALQGLETVIRNVTELAKVLKK
jgi:hypothetical protein